MVYQKYGGDHVEKLSSNRFVILLTIIASVATLVEMHDGTWRGLFLLSAIFFFIVFVLSTIATWIQQSDRPDKYKAFVIGATATLMVFIFLFALLWQLGYTLNKLESPGSGPFKEGNNISINITYPGEEKFIDHPQQVAGKFSGKLPEGIHAWLLSSLSGQTYRWWQPIGEIIPDKGYWEIKEAYIGGVNDSRYKFEIAAVLVNDEWHEYFKYYKQNANDDTFWWNFPLPVDEFPIKDKIDVFRK